MKKRGKLFVVSGLSGAGKDSVIEGLKAKKLDFNWVVTTTTRSPRPGESEGKPYYFVSVEKFEEMIANNEFLEWAKVYDNYYGNTKKEVEGALEKGKPVILKIDYQGATTIKGKMPASIVIFIIPPSLEILEERIRRRGGDPEEAIQRRLAEAKKEMEGLDRWDYVVTNEEGKLEETVEEVAKIIQKSDSPT